MFYQNARIYCSDFTFRNGAFEVTEDGKFGAILPENVPADAVDLGGQQYFLKGGLARLADGTIAGSASNLYDGLCKAIGFGIPEADVVRACTYNPACALSAQDKVGSIQEGMLADFLVCPPDYAEKRVFMGGKELT